MGAAAALMIVLGYPGEFARDIPTRAIWDTRSQKFEPIIVAQAFQLLASIAVPHLMLSQWLEGRLPAVAFSEEKTLTA